MIISCSHFVKLWGLEVFQHAGNLQPESTLDPALGVYLFPWTVRYDRRIMIMMNTTMNHIIGSSENRNIRGAHLQSVV